VARSGTCSKCFVHKGTTTTATKEVSLKDAKVECAKNITHKWSLFGTVVGIPLGIYLKRYYPLFIGVGLGAAIDFWSFKNCVREHAQPHKSSWIRFQKKDIVSQDLEEYRKRQQQTKTEKSL